MLTDLADVDGTTATIVDADTLIKRTAADGIVREVTVGAVKANIKAESDATYEPLLGFVPADSALIAQPNGIATLGADGRVPSGQLPSFVDDVLEFDSVANFLPLVSRVKYTLPSTLTRRIVGQVLRTYTSHQELLIVWLGRQVL